MYSTKDCITEEAVRSSGLRVLPLNTLLVTSRATIGEVAIAGIPITTNQGFQNLIPRDGTSHLWLYYYLQHEKPRLERLASGSTFREFSRQSMKALEVLVPPLTEQRAIAAILDSIDEAIERAEEVIAATDALRQALLQDLLTRGVPGWHKEWKHVPGIGTIPADWQVVRLGEVTEEFRYGTSVLSTTEPVGAPVLRIPNIVQGRLDLSDLKYACLPRGEAAITRLKEGDVLVVRTNGNPKLCGRSWVVNGLIGEWHFASYLIRIRVNPRLLPEYLGLYMHSSCGRRQLTGNIRTSAGNYNLSASGLADMEVAVPSLQEQRLVVDAAASLDVLIGSSEAQRLQLQILKHGAADALLSGRVRVPAG